MWLRYTSRRVDCPRCGVVVEIVPWAENQSWFTYEFEEQVAYLAQRADKMTLSKLMRISWNTVRVLSSSECSHVIGRWTRSMA